MNAVEKVQEQLKLAIREAVVKAGLATEEQVPSIMLETPKDKTHGDYATNTAMQLARVARKAPRQIAEDIKAAIDLEKAAVQKVEIAGPGFINFYMNNSYLTDLIPLVLEQGKAYGSSDYGQNKTVNVEFVSANPTGDLHLGHARGAAVGDSLCNILDMAGFDVTREYYINDAGNQIHNLAKSVEARYFQALGEDFPMPEDGYHGQDIITIGKELATEFGAKYKDVSEEERYEFFRSYGLKVEMKKLQQDLQDFRVNFDVWYSETSLYQNGKIDEALQALRNNGHIYEEDGATWFRSTELQDDKDRVLIKNDGTYTYLTPDIAYHKDKFNRGHDTLINIWGADHHGYIPRMKAAVEALGFDREKLEVEVIQLVHLYKDGEKMKMSKRTGKAVTMRDLVEEVGLDATRYFFAMRSADTHMDFDLDLAVSQSNENPVYYAQYAHARIHSILRTAAEQGFAVDGEVDYTHISSEKEYDVLKQIGDFPAIVAEAAEKRIPHRIANYITDLAAAFHSFYNAEKVLDGEHPERTKARLALIQSVAQTISNALTLIGVAAPEKM